MNPSKLKVVELRAELSARGLDTKGIKSVLVERLQEALDKESGGEGRKEEDAKDSPSSEAANECELNTTEQNSSDNQDHNEESPTAKQNTQENEMDKVDEGACDEQSQDQTNYEQPPKTDKENGENSMDVQGNYDQDHKENDVENQEEMQDPDQNGGGDRHWDRSQQNYSQDQEDSNKMEEDNSESCANQEEARQDGTDMEVKQEPLTDSGYDENPVGGVPKEEKDKDGYESHVKNEPYEGNDSKHIKSENEIKSERDSYREDRKRKRSLSPSPYKNRQQSPVRQIKEEEPELKDTDVTLSWYDSDLNLMIDKDSLYSATPMTQGGFGYIWAGARGTHAYNSGKLCFQVKLIENCKVSHLENEPNPNVLRIGWSTLDTSMQLGEEPLSFGYGGTGKISVNCQFSNYGKPFGEGDVVTTYLEFQNEEFVISYSVNGEHLGVAWQLPLQELQDKPLAPHILTKNVKFAVNFGQTEPWGEVDEGFTFVKNIPVEQAFCGPKRPEKRSECEIIMMCGLPACGKTTWANEYSKEHPEKRYNIIGTNALIDKMKVMGLPRKANYSGRWDILIDKCTKCLNKLMDVGAHRRRNYILDQTNVYPAAQRRKMRNFEGFTRKAVVIVPTDEEFKTRTQKQAQQEKKDVPENAVMEMKANFCLPDKSLFSEIIFAELDENESRALVHKYNKEAAAAGFARKGPIGGGGGGSGSGGGGGRGGGGPNAKRFRGDFGHGGQHGGHQQHHGGGGGQRHDGFRRGPPPSSPFRSQYRGPPGGSGGHGGGGGSGGGGGGGRGGWQPPRGTPDRWRDNRNHGSGGGGGGYRQGGGGGGGAGGDRAGGGWRGGNQGGNRGGNRDYDGDRNSRGGNFGVDRNRGGRGAGGGGGGGSRDGGGRQGGGGYSSRDSGRDNWNKRGQGGGGSGGGGGGGSLNSGSTGGSISASNPQSNNQWGQYQSGGGQNQGQMTPSGGGQSWGAQQSWGSPQQQQQWGNYQQGWKGYNQTYSQGYNQQGYSQPTGYGNWQYGYPGYQNWGQNWQNWYQTQNAAAAGQTNTSQPPPSK